MKNSQLSKQIKLMALDIPAGSTKNGQVCPQCGGGVRNDRAFSITKTRDDTLLYICYRATCGLTGGLSVSGTSTGAAPSPSAPSYKIAETRDLTGEERAFFKRKFAGISCYYEQNLHAARDCVGGVISRIFNRFGGSNGHVLRKYTELGWDGYGNKSLTFYEDDTTDRGDFRCCTKSSLVYVVEDQISADCINNVTGNAAYAILGSHISDDVIYTLRSMGYKQIVIALDADAWRKAEKFAKRFVLLGVFMLTWSSELDPKDMSIKELEEVFK